MSTAQLAPAPFVPAVEHCLEPRVSSVPNEPLDPLSKLCPEDLPCRIQDADMWFSDTPADLELAKSFCRACPAQLVCLAGAVERHEPWGVWGGEIFHRGVVVARKRPRGRPRKDARPEVAA